MPIKQPIILGLHFLSLTTYCLSFSARLGKWVNYLIFFYLFIYLFIYLFLAALGLRFCARAPSSCGKRGPLFIAMRGPLTVAAPLVAEHRLQTRRPSSRGSRAQPLRGMWDPPRPGPEPVSPALAGRLPTTAPPGKPLHWFFVAARAFSSCGQRGLLFVAAHRLLVAVASLVVELGL